ncbi:demethoxyubiquinone hydroxylase family protein [Sandaracinobacter neustonicus]|uniref:3-demethoxyubiquinol 3-hydroxylase n=2 Tax=Sandaracinobacter neustonicus TaxID=1715348 RepID=A0A501XV98_9SPHN|nr:demethoxyubiquinone hydroxylase family protein [Sandaracinobacter neustonicus]
MIRVDHAGEYGAKRIYAGQLAVMGTRHPYSGEIARMEAQEDVHLNAFAQLVTERGVRPTLLMPLWHVAGFALGAASALAGPKAAMAVTAAVETEIDRHYQAQRDALAGDDPDLEALIAKFQAEEVEHRDSAIAHGAEQAPAYPLLSALVRAGCRAAIRAAERV